jgi:serpin B
MTASVFGANISSPGAPDVSPGAVVEGNATFALDLYRREKGKTANLVFSPYSISTALAMTYAGARGPTAEEMARTLHFELPPADLHQGFADLAARFDQIEKEKHINFSVANSLWCQRGYAFEPAFLDLNRNDYHAELRQVDFMTKAEDIRREINAWVERKTDDKIRDLLKPGQLGSMTRLVLCDAIYFKGDWATRFDPKATQPEPFFITSNQSVTVPMMSRTFKLRSRELDDMSLFALPYTGNDLSMIILLPADREGLAALEQRLTAAAWQGWLKALNTAPELEATVALPRFKLNCRLDLANDLAAMGMPSAFRANADFSGINGKRDLFISGVVHQAYVDMNEQGTEAAAATGVTMRALSLRRAEVLRVDHPFLFFIVERQTGTLLFLGRVADPTK